MLVNDGEHIRNTLYFSVDVIPATLTLENSWFECVSTPIPRTNRMLSQWLCVGTTARSCCLYAFSINQSLNKTVYNRNFRLEANRQRVFFYSRQYSRLIQSSHYYEILKCAFGMPTSQRGLHVNVNYCRNADMFKSGHRQRHAVSHQYLYTFVCLSVCFDIASLFPFSR